MSFFIATDGYAYPTSSIEKFSIHYDGDDETVLKVHLANGEGRVDVVANHAEALLRSPDFAVPAQPGTFYVSILDLGLNGKTVWFQTIIAWLIRGQGEPIPVTPHGPKAGVQNLYVVRLPNGTITDYGQNDYESLEQWLAVEGFSDDQIEAALLVEQAAVRTPTSAR